MSDNKEQKKDDSLQEVVRRVVITPEDCSGALEFWTRFEVPLSQELRDAFDAFMKEPTLANQDRVKYEITHAVAYTEHEAFKDEMFKEIVEECKSIYDELSFDKALEKTLTDEEGSST